MKVQSAKSPIFNISSLPDTWAEEEDLIVAAGADGWSAEDVDALLDAGADVAQA